MENSMTNKTVTLLFTEDGALYKDGVLIDGYESGAGITADGEYRITLIDCARNVSEYASAIDAVKPEATLSGVEWRQDGRWRYVEMPKQEAEARCTSTAKRLNLRSGAHSPARGDTWFMRKRKAFKSKPKKDNVGACGDRRGGRSRDSTGTGARDNVVNSMGKKEINLVDKVARLMKLGNSNEIKTGYNVQTAADSKHALITGFEITNSAADAGILYEMSKRAKELLDMDGLTVLAYKGYSEGAEIKKCNEDGMTCLIAKYDFENNGNALHVSKFKYDETQDAYICPQNGVIPLFLLPYQKNQSNVFRTKPINIFYRLSSKNFPCEKGGLFRRLVSPLLP
jgi:hypothetical protein